MARRSAWMARSACSRNNRGTHARGSGARGQAVTEASSAASSIERERLQYDVVIVGAGPAGLACAIRLKQLKPAASACVLEKAAALGAHSLSGAVLEPGPLEQLLPEWSREDPGVMLPAAESTRATLPPPGSLKPVPDFLLKLLPRSMTYSTPFDNHGNYIISLGQLTPWLPHQGGRGS